MYNDEDRELGRGNAIWVPTIGFPAGQIKWSRMLNLIFRNEGINAVASPLELPPESIGSFLDIVRSSGSIRGFSVTIPHKIPLVQAMDSLTARAKRARSINVVVKDAQTGLLTGDIIDGLGFMKNLASSKVAVDGRRILLFGAGGVGRAIAAALLDHRPARFVVTDISGDRALDLTGHAAGIETLDIEAAQRLVAEFDIIINATPLGMNVDDPLPFDPSLCGEQTCIVDVVNREGSTTLAKRARESGLAYVGGGGMLEGQIDAFLDLLGLAPRH